MKVETTNIDGLLIITPDVFGDERGYFMESHNVARYKEHGIPDFVQDNESRSQKGVIRGLHYQLPPYGQGKLVRVVEGEVLDVAVDLRPDSPTLGQHVAVTLSGENKKQFWIPAGFAHGFLTLSETVLFQYKCTALYHKEADRGIRWNDPALAITWPVAAPIISGKDQNQPMFEVAMEELKNVCE
jgi:dTDP-4-dehydrorhamnose 3,5-epimerase